MKSPKTSKYTEYLKKYRNINYKGQIYHQKNIYIFVFTYLPNLIRINLYSFSKHVCEKLAKISRAKVFTSQNACL